MGKFFEFTNRLKQLTPDQMEQLSLVAVEKKSESFIKLNQEQLFEGLDSKGKSIEPPYASDSYANYKLKRNPLGVVDLFLTGAFYGSFFMYTTNYPVYIFASDVKTRSLAGKYGTDIFGVAKENIKTIPLLTDFAKGIRDFLHI